MIISIISAIKNEENTIQNFLDKFYEQINLERDSNALYQLILIENSSTDLTIQKVKQYKNLDNVTLIKIKENINQCNAIEVGFIAGGLGQILVMQDADLQHPLSVSMSLANRVKEGYDIAQAVRTSKKSSKVRKNITSFYNISMQLFFGIPLRKQNTYFKAVNTSHLSEIVTKRPSYWRYMRLSKREINNSRIFYLDFDSPQRTSDKTKYSFMRLINFGITGLISTVSPNRFSAILAIFIILVSISLKIELLLEIFILYFVSFIILDQVQRIETNRKLITIDEMLVGKHCQIDIYNLKKLF
jgi:glycosyltransferase involved in cell wall biosynthesis